MSQKEAVACLKMGNSFLEVLSFVSSHSRSVVMRERFPENTTENRIYDCRNGDGGDDIEARKAEVNSNAQRRDSEQLRDKRGQIQPTDDWHWL